MTSSPGQSYYEIALTNRQVLAVFVVLLIAVLAAFVGGVWVGRHGPLAQVQTVDAETITATSEEGDEPLERFEFFSREDGEPAEVIPATEPATVDAGEPEIAEAPVEPESADATDGTPEMEPLAPLEERSERRRRREPDPEPEPEEAQVAETVPEPPASESEPAAPSEPESAAAAPTGALVVQVFSSSNQVQAQSVVDRLRSGGFPALLSPVEVSGRTMYRVRIGPYSERREAEGVAEQIRSDYRLETWITQ